MAIDGAIGTQGSISVNPTVATSTSGTGAVASTGALSTGYKNNDISSKSVSVEALTKTTNTYMRMGAYWTAMGENPDVLMALYNKTFNLKDVYIGTYQDSTSKADNKTCFTFGMRYRPATTNKGGFPVRKGMKGSIFLQEGPSDKTIFLQYTKGTTGHSEGVVDKTVVTSSRAIRWQKGDYCATGYGLGATPSQTALLGFYHSFGAYGQIMVGWLYNSKRSANFQNKYWTILKSTLKESHVAAMTMLSWQWGDWYITGASSSIKEEGKITSITEVKVNLWNAIMAHLKSIYEKKSADVQQVYLDKVETGFMMFAYAGYNQTGKPVFKSEHEQNRRIREFKIYCGQASDLTNMTIPDAYNKGIFAGAEELTSEEFKGETYTVVMESKEELDRMVAEYNFVAGDDGVAATKYRNAVINAMSEKDEAKRNAALDAAADEYGKSIKKTSSTNAKVKDIKSTSSAMSESTDIKYDWFNDTGVYYGLMAKSGDTNIKNKNLNRRYHYDKFKKYPTATEWDASQLKQAKVFFVRPDMNLYPNNGPNPEVEDITLSHNIVIDSDVAKYLDASYGTEKPVAGITKEDKTFKTYFIPILTNQFLETSLLDAKMAFVKSSANVKGVDVSVGRYDSTDTSDTELSFTFNVDNYNSVYRLIDVWFKYVQAIGEGTISPKPENSIHNRLDYTSTVYGFLLGADGLTINHWYASIGIIPTANLSNTFVYKSAGENVKEIQVPFLTNTPIENRKLETINEFNYLQSKPYDDGEEADISTFILNYNKIEYIISDNMIRDDWYAESFRVVFDLDLEVFKLIPIPTIELVRKYIKLANISDDKVFDKGKDYSTLDAIKEMFASYKATDTSVVSDYFAEEFIVRSRALNDKGDSLAVSKKGTVPVDGSYSRLSKMMNNEDIILLGDEQFTKETKEKTDRVMAHLSKDDKRDVKKNLTYDMMLGVESDNRASADITFGNLSDLKKSDSPLSKRVKGNMETEYVSFADNPLIEAIPEGKNSIESIGRNHIKIGSDSLALTKDKNFLIDFLKLQRMDIIQKGVNPYNTYDENKKIKDTTWGTNLTYINPHIDTKNRNTIDESKALSYIKANNLSDGSDKDRVSMLYSNSSGRTDFGMFDDNARKDDSTHIMGQIWKVRKIGARASTPLDILTSVISKIDKTDISSLKIINQPLNNSDNSVSFAKDSRNPFRTTDTKDGVSVIDLLKLKSNTVVQFLNKQPDANSTEKPEVINYETYASGMTAIVDKSLVGNDASTHKFTSGNFDFSNKQQKLNDSTDKANDHLKDGVIYISKQLKDNLNEAQLLISSKERDIEKVLTTMQKITTNYFEDSYATLTEGTPAQYDKYGVQTKAATPATRVEKNKFVSGSSGRIDPAVYKDPYLFSSDKTLFSIQDPNIKSKKNTTVLSALKNLYNADGTMNELANNASKGLRTGYNYKFAEDFTSMSFAEFELGADHRNNLVNTGVFNTTIDSNTMELPDTIPAETFDYKSILGSDVMTDKGADVYFNNLALKVGLSSYAMERIISVDARTNNDKQDDYKFNTKNTTMNPDFEVALNNNKVFISVNPETGELVADVQAVLEPSKKDKLLGYMKDAIKSFGTNAVMNFAAIVTNRIFYNDADIKFKTKGTFYEEEPINPEYDIKPLENIIVDTSKDEFVTEVIPKYHELQELLSEAQKNINKANETISTYTPDVHETFVDIIEKSKENWINTQQYKENYNPSLPNVPELINTEELSKIVLGNEDSILKSLNKDILKSTTALEETQLLNITNDKLNNENIRVNLFGDTLFNLKQETYLREQHNADYMNRFYNDDGTPIDPIYNKYLASVAPSFKALMNLNLTVVKKDELEEVPISYSEVNPEFLMLAGRLSKMEILYENNTIPDSESKFSALSSKLNKIDKSFEYGRENYDPAIPDSKPTLNALLKMFKVL